MIRTGNFVEDGRFFDAPRQDLRNEKVVDSPTDVVLPRAGAVAPPAVSILATNVQFLKLFEYNTSVAATTLNKVAVVLDELITKLQSCILFDLNSCEAVT